MRDPARPRHPIRRVVSSLGVLAIVGVAVLVASGQSGGFGFGSPWCRVGQWRVGQGRPPARGPRS
jgi:hypothetical protein